MIRFSPTFTEAISLGELSRSRLPPRVKIGTRLGVDSSLTWTCYRGEALACGRCGSCMERQEAFREVGVEDPVEYG